MAKQKEIAMERVVIFVEGDTDELFFKALLEYYKSVSQTELKTCEVCNLKGVTRYSTKLLAKLKNEILPEAKRRNVRIHTVCCSYDTDVFEVKNPLMVNWDAIGKSIRKMGIVGFVRIGVRSSIEDWILDDIEGVCSFLKLKQIPKSIKGVNGNAKLNDLFSKAKRSYNKGYSASEMIKALDFDIIRKKRQDVLRPLEEALGVVIPKSLGLYQ